MELTEEQKAAKAKAEAKAIMEAKAAAAMAKMAAERKAAAEAKVVAERAANEPLDAKAAAEAKVLAAVKATAEAKAKEAANMAATFESRDPTAIWLKARGLKLATWREHSAAEAGKDNVDWLLDCVEATSATMNADEHLDVRSQFNCPEVNGKKYAPGDRKAILMNIGVLTTAIASFDLRDNIITDAECTTIAEFIEPQQPPLKMSKLTLAGNRIGAKGLAAIGKAMTVTELLVDGTSKNRPSSVTDLDLSRNLVCRVDAPAEGTAADGSEEASGELSAAAVDGLVELARACSRSQRLSVLGLGRSELDDSAGAAFCSSMYEHAPKADVPVVDTKGMSKQAAAAALAAAQAAVKPPPAMVLMKLDLSRNHLGAAFGEALGEALTVTPALIQLNLHGNGLGVAGGVAVANALARSTSLKEVDLSSNNLCNCNPKYATSATRTWRGEAIAAIAEMLMNGATLQVCTLAAYPHLPFLSPHPFLSPASSYPLLSPPSLTPHPRLAPLPSPCPHSTSFSAATSSRACGRSG